VTPRTSPDSTRAYICLGSNIQPDVHIVGAVERLAGSLRVVGASRVYESEAKGSAGAPRFLNAAIMVDTDLAPRVLKFEVLRPIERELGRVRTADPNEPRTIDLDLALYGAVVTEDPTGDLILPDPDILRCAHVTLPLADLAPRLRHPVTGEALGSIAQRLAEASDIRVVSGLRLVVQDP
jgi:2-amino-4-hydroxy-6-hydroxymethyldihydropteridine diphosphokinase